MADPKGFLVVPLAFNPSGDIRALECDADDNLIVSVKELLSTLTVNVEPGVNPIVVQAEPGASPIIVDGQSPSIFRPIPKINYYANTSIGAGNTNHDVVTVPASEYWDVNYVSFVYVGTVTGVNLVLRFVDGANDYVLWSQTGITSGASYGINCRILINPGTIIRGTVQNGTLNDDIYIRSFCRRIY